MVKKKKKKKNQIKKKKIKYGDIHMSREKKSF